MASWRTAAYPAAHEADDGGGGAGEAISEALQIMWGWVRIPLIVIAVLVVVYFVLISGVFSPGAKSCYICGQPYKTGYTLSVKRNFSIKEAAGKVSASFKGDAPDAPDVPDASRRYDLCEGCEATVVQYLSGARNGGPQ